MPETFKKSCISRQEDFSNSQPQRLSQLTIRNCPLRLPLMKFFKLSIEGFEPIFHHRSRNSANTTISRTRALNGETLENLQIKTVAA